jgi:hypothetical protein
MSTLKKQRLASAEAQPVSENPCLRCVGHYGDGFDVEGPKKATLCRFPAGTAEMSFPGPVGATRFFKCWLCTNTGQDCFEVGKLVQYGVLWLICG